MTIGVFAAFAFLATFAARLAFSFAVVVLWWRSLWVVRFGVLGFRWEGSGDWDVGRVRCLWVPGFATVVVTFG